MEYQLHTLKNGIRILHVPVEGTIAHACVVINTGSRDEPADKPGLAHFLEHLIFKHTQKRNTVQILNRLESVGADLNAYTTKEYTCVHASFLAPYLDRSLELFEDILFHSTFPESEIEKEKEVVLDEIASYLDSPEEAIYDDFEALIFKNHALGNNILGNTESVANFSAEDIKAFIKNTYRTDEIVVAVLGPYDFKKVKRIAEKYFAGHAENLPAKPRVAPLIYQPIQLQIDKPISQAHTIVGMPTYSVHHPNKVGLMLLNHHLGGSSMSSLLNLELREKHGIAYTIESHYMPLQDTGLFSIYFGTDKDKLKKALKLIDKTQQQILKNPINDLRLSKIKKKYIGQIALSEENKMGLLISMTKSLLDHQSIDSLKTVFAKIDAVTVENFNEIAQEMFNESQLSTLTFHPLID